MIKVIVQYDDGSRMEYMIPEDEDGSLPLEIAMVLWDEKESMKAFDPEGRVIID